jgi:hypothetical protein
LRTRARLCPSRSHTFSSPTQHKHHRNKNQNRPERWALHHEIAALERAFRRVLGRPSPTAPAPAGGGSSADLQQQAQQAANAPDPFGAHVDWALPALAAIVRCLHGLVAPAVRLGPLAPISEAFEMDPIERSLRAGHEKDASLARRAAAQQQQGLQGQQQQQQGGGGDDFANTIAGTTPAALRYWLRAVREGSYLALASAAGSLGDAALWLRQDLAAAVPSALASGLQDMELRHLRGLMRHGVAPLAQHCPQGVRGPWLLGLLCALLPAVHARLSEGWARVAAAAASTSSSASAGSSPSGLAAAAAAGLAAAGLGVAVGVGGGGGDSTTPPSAADGSKGAAVDAQLDEVVLESVLRDVTREAMALCVRLCERRGEWAVRYHSGADGGGGALGLAAAAAQAAANGGAQPPSSGLAQAQQSAQLLQQPPPPEGESVVDTLWAHWPEAAAPALQALAALSASALALWPDGPAAQRATICARFLVLLSAGPRPELAPFVCGPLLQSAIASSLAVSSVPIQADVLAVLRAALVAWMPRSPLPAQLLLRLAPAALTPARVDAFQRALLATASEKEQRALVKGLLAEAGGEEARAVLNAVSRVQTVVNMPLSAAGGGGGGGGGGRRRRGGGGGRGGGRGGGGGGGGAGGEADEFLRVDWSEGGVVI